VRLRPGRVVAAAASLAVTMVALLGFLGVIPVDGSGPDAPQVVAGAAKVAADPDTSAAAGVSSSTGTAASRSEQDTTVSHALDQVSQPGTETRVSNALPDNSGQGRRVVFSRSAQRVWLVDRSNAVASTYLVSGSVTNNLGPGSYSVYSRSRWAVGVDDSGVMQYFVRFAHGQHAAIGFHSIPTKLGKPLQKISQLGSPQSHGCIRQNMPDAIALWNFAPDGTKVVVVA